MSLATDRTDASEPVYHQTWLERGSERLGLQLYPEPADVRAPLFVVWPAMGVPAHYYRPLTEGLSEAGAAVAVADLRGTGSSEPRPTRRSAYGYAELVGDVGAVLDELRTDGRRVFLLGHSLGGQACLMHLATTQDPRVEAVALVAVALPYWRAYDGLQRAFVLPFTQSIGLASAVLGVWPGWGFGGRLSRGVARDWAYTARKGRFPDLNGTDMRDALSHVHKPVLAISVEDDQYTPKSAMDYLCDRLVNAKITQLHLTADEAGDRLDHFRWARRPDWIVARVAEFAAVSGDPPDGDRGRRGS